MICDVVSPTDDYAKETKILSKLYFCSLVNRKKTRTNLILV